MWQAWSVGVGRVITDTPVPLKWAILAEVTQVG